MVDGISIPEKNAAFCDGITNFWIQQKFHFFHFFTLRSVEGPRFYDPFVYSGPFLWYTGIRKEGCPINQIKIGQFIAGTRKAKHLTQRQLADALSISDKTVSKWETGKGCRTSP